MGVARQADTGRQTRESHDDELGKLLIEGGQPRPPNRIRRVRIAGLELVPIARAARQAPFAAVRFGFRFSIALDELDLRHLPATSTIRLSLPAGTSRASDDTEYQEYCLRSHSSGRKAHAHWRSASMPGVIGSVH